ncbi:MAG: ABC transporter substrate-binding protein [Clostridia bacterium]|nr:ABC transporter substrate-binding protein [Clostridia bacterium]
MKKVFVSKKFFVLLLSALFIFISACSANPTLENNESAGELSEYENAHEVPEDGGILRLSFVGIQNLNPLLVKNQNNLYVLKLIFDGLFQVSPNDFAEPVLCDRYVISPDGINYEFVIKQGIKFHNGASLSARDVDASLSLILNGEGIYKNKLAGIASHSYSGNSLFITLNQPIVNFISLLDFPILSADDLSGNWDQYVPNGTGRYKVQSYKINKELYLSKNENYYKPFSPHISEISVTFVKDSATAVSMLENFQIDLLPSDVMDPSSYTPKRSLTSTEISGGRFTFLGINNQHIALLSPKTRQAISYAINREDVLQQSSVQYATITDLPFTKHSFWYNNQLPDPIFNKELANQLLVDDGWHDTDGDGLLDKTIYGEKADLSISILVNANNAPKLKTAEAVSKYLNDAGIKTYVDAVSFDDYQTRINEGSFHLFIGETSFSANYDLSFLLKTDQNVCGISNEKIDQALNALVYQESPSIKQKLFYELCEVLKNETQIAGLYFENRILIFDQRIKGDITPSNTDIFYGIENWFISQN